MRVYDGELANGRARRVSGVIVTIDGPAGAGKSTAARGLARRLGFSYLDTGAMYRAVTLVAIESNIHAEDAVALLSAIDRLSLDQRDGTVLIDGVDRGSELRSVDVTRRVKEYADSPTVRSAMVEQQRAFAQRRDLVTEGRDQGTIVFPRATCKFYLTATEDDRARRRQVDLAEIGQEVSLSDVKGDQRRRDQDDQNRAIAPLEPAHDAIHVDTSGLSIEEVLDVLERRARERMSNQP